MFKIFQFILKYFDKVILFFFFTFVPFIVFMFLLFYFKTKTDDLHLIFIMSTNTVLFININVLGIVLIKKINKVIKLIKLNEK